MLDAPTLDDDGGDGRGPLTFVLMVYPEDVLKAAMVAANTGLPEMQVRLHGAACHLHAMYERAGSTEPMPCVCCFQALATPDGSLIGLVADDHAALITLSVCPGCAAWPRAHFWPAIRAVVRSAFPDAIMDFGYATLGGWLA